jgi:hypothetical protein
MRQVHLRTSGLQRVDGPVPAIGRLENHLRALTGACHHRVELIDIIEDLDRLQDIAGFGRPDQHTPAAMQIDTDKLSACVL